MHHTGHIQTAGIDQIKRAALRIGIDIGRFEDDFLLKNGKRLNRDRFIRPGQAEHHYDCLGAGQFNGLLDGGRPADAFDNRVQTEHAVRGECCRHVLVQRIDADIRAKRFTDRAFTFDRLQQRDTRRARKPCQLHHNQADHSAADHGDMAAGSDLAHIHAVQTAGDRFGHCALLERSTVSERVNLLFVDCAVFRESAVHSGAVAGHVRAVMRHTVAAEFACPAIVIGIDAHAVPFAVARDRAAGIRDNAGEFVSQNRGGMGFGRALVPFENMHIRTADAACLDLDQHIVRADGGDGSLSGYHACRKKLRFS